MWDDKTRPQPGFARVDDVSIAGREGLKNSSRHRLTDEEATLISASPERRDSGELKRNDGEITVPGLNGLGNEFTKFFDK